MNSTHVVLATALPAVAAASPGAAADAQSGDEFARCLDAATTDEPAPPATDKRSQTNAPARTRMRRETPAKPEATPSTPVVDVDALITGAAEAGVADVAGEAAAGKAAAPLLGTVPGESTCALPAWAFAHDHAPLPAPGDAPAAGRDVAEAVLAAVAEGRPRAPAVHEALAARAEHADAALPGADSANPTPPVVPLATPQVLQAGARDENAPKISLPAEPLSAPTPLPFAGAAALAARAHETAAPLDGHIAAPIDSPAFAPALATQVRWLARDGVQSAQLSLNPPEMGPLSVQIVIHDGRHTRIDFIADMAATRQAIEQSLPVLAAALDDSGLTLSGGGVHDGRASAGQQQQASDGRSMPSHAGRPDPRLGESHDARDGAVPAPPGVFQGARGLVDLVA